MRGRENNDRERERRRGIWREQNPGQVRSLPRYTQVEWLVGSLAAGFSPIIDPLHSVVRWQREHRVRAYVERLKSIKNETSFTPSGRRRNQ